jgi:hypothetical protein
MLTPGGDCAPNCTAPRAGRVPSAVTECGFKPKSDTAATVTAATTVVRMYRRLRGTVWELGLYWDADVRFTADLRFLDIIRNPPSEKVAVNGLGLIVNIWLNFYDEYGYVMVILYGKKIFF